MENTRAVFVIGLVHAGHAGKSDEEKRIFDAYTTDVYKSSRLMAAALHATPVPVEKIFASMRSSEFHGKVLGVVQVSPGVYYESSLTKFTPIEMALWQTLNMAQMHSLIKLSEHAPLQNLCSHGIKKSDSQTRT